MVDGSVPGLHRRGPTTGDVLVGASYAGLILGVYLLGVVAGTLATGEVTVHPFVLDPVLAPGLFLYAPPVVAAVNRRRGGSLLGTLLTGLVPGVTFALLGIVATLVGTSGGHTPLWVNAGFYATFGLLGTLAGIGAVHLVALWTRRWNDRR